MAPKIPSTIPCSSVHDLERELKPISDTLALEETEETWDKISTSLLLLTALIKGGAAEFPKDITSVLKSLSRPINNALCSERSRLSGFAIDMLSELAPALGHSFEPLLHIFLPTLLSLATRTNKLSISRTKSCLLAIIEHTQLPAILPHLRNAVTDKSVSLRLVATEAILACMNCFNPPDLDTQARAEDIEAVIRTTARDASADVRKSSRKVFEAYMILLPDRVDAFTAPLTPVTKKYLDIKCKPTLSTSMSAHAAAMSASTSAVPSSKSTSLAAAQRPPAHTRSASSSVLEAKKEVTSDGKRRMGKERERSDMAPPSNVPFRPPPTGSAVASTSTNNRTVSNTHSATSGAPSRAPSRPTSALSACAPLATDEVISAGRPVIKARAVAMPSVTRDGPSRPPIDMVMASGNLASVNPPQRVIGGARRVPKPTMQDAPPGPAPAAESDARGRERQHEQKAKSVERSRSRPAGKVIAKDEAALPPSRPEQASKPTTSSQQPRNTDEAKPLPVETKAMEKPARPRTMSTFSKALNDPKNNSHKPALREVSSSSSTVGSKPPQPQPTGFAPRRNAPTNGVTAPTLSQLAKSKGVAKPMEVKAAKPGWGRPPPPKGSVALTKPLVPKKRAAEINAKEPLPKAPQVIVKPELAPSPPSLAVIPASIPLPESPTLHGQDTPTPFSLDADISQDNLQQPLEPALSVPAQSTAGPMQFLLSPAEPMTPTARVNLSSHLHLTQVSTPISALLSSIQNGFVYTPAPGETTFSFSSAEGGADRLDESFANESVGVEFKMDGVDAFGGVAETPVKRQVFVGGNKVLPVANLVACRNIFAEVN